MNPFQNNYINRLQEWRQLRLDCVDLPLDQACVKIDSWWQRAPFVTRHLHWQDQSSWPDPWTLLSENTYCHLTRALGMCYTLLLSNIEVIELVHARDCQSEEHYLVIVDGAKYVLNYWPDSVLSTSPDEFTVISSKSLESLKNKIK